MISPSVVCFVFHGADVGQIQRRPKFEGPQNEHCSNLNQQTKLQSCLVRNVQYPDLLPYQDAKLALLTMRLSIYNHRKRKRRPRREEIHHFICKGRTSVPCRSYWKIPPYRKARKPYRRRSTCIPRCCSRVPLC